MTKYFSDYVPDVTKYFSDYVPDVTKYFSDYVPWYSTVQILGLYSQSHWGPPFKCLISSEVICIHGFRVVRNLNDILSSMIIYLPEHQDLPTWNMLCLMRILAAWIFSRSRLRALSGRLDYTIGWSDFWGERNWSLGKLCHIVIGLQFQNFTS